MANTTSPDNDAVLADALAAFRDHDFAKVVLITRKIVISDPSHSSAWNLLGLATDALGNTRDAAAIFEQGLAANPQSPILHNAAGILYTKLGAAVKAKLHLQRAVAIDPTYVEAWINLGNFLIQTKQWSEAEQAFRSAMATAPEQPRFAMEMAKLFIVQDRPDDAETFLRQADALARTYAVPPGTDTHAAGNPGLKQEILARIGAWHLRNSQPLKALDYLQEAVELGENQSTQRLFIRCLFDVDFTAPRPSLKPFLLRAIDKRWAMLSDLSRVSANLLLLEPDFRKVLALLESGRTDDLLHAAAVQSVISDPLFLAMLANVVITNPVMEFILAGLRHTLLQSTDRAGPDVLTFASALANQCFGTEYAYRETPQENELVRALGEKIAKALPGGRPPTPLELVVLASYRPLDQLAETAEILVQEWPAAVQQVVDRQLRFRREEDQLRDAMPRLTAIGDDVSRAVREQYEINPYPAWLNTPIPPRHYDSQDWLRRSFPKAPQLPALAEGQRRQVLVAGCGTGEESVGLALLLDQVEILSVDLSLSSLAYAARMTREVGITNISYGQADILELGGIGRQFDIVVSAGVLHHLENPVKGWKVLADLTAPGGCMLIALYSELGRRALVAVREFAAERGYGVSNAELRRFRADIYALPPGDPRRETLVVRDDFYNLSMLRDLVFHVQEHRFTIPQIASTLHDLNLRFCGFASDTRMLKKFRESFGAQVDILSLEAWAVLEKENPDMFSGMYHFLAQKPE